MATVLEFNLDEISESTSDAALNQRSAILVGQVKACYLELYQLREAKKPILQHDLEAQHELLKETLREKKKAISNLTAAKNKFNERHQAASKSSETAQLKLEAIKGAAPNDDDFPSKEEIAAYNKNLADAESEVSEAEAVYNRLTPQLRYFDDELAKLQTEFDALRRQELELRAKVKPEKISPKDMSRLSISNTLSKLLSK